MKSSINYTTLGKIGCTFDPPFVKILFKMNAIEKNKNKIQTKSKKLVVFTCIVCVCVLCDSFILLREKYIE